MIVDSHVHITSPYLIKHHERVAAQEDYFRLLSESPVNKFSTAEEVIQEMKISGVDKAIVFGFPFYSQDLCKMSNAKSLA